MIFHKHIPTLPLSEYVDCIVYIEGNNKGIGFPKTAMSLVFNLDDSFKLFADNRFLQFTDYKKYWVAGLQTEPTYVESYGKSKMVVIQFKTAGAWFFLKQPLKYFTGNYIDLDCIFKTDAAETWERLSETVSVPEKILLVENFLRKKLITGETPRWKLLPAVEMLFKNQSPVSIEAVCREYNVSRKHLNYLFKEYLGISPKMLSSLNRFQKMLQAIGRSGRDKLTNIAYELDFFDQAHFNNNFKKFTGLKPNEYARNLELTPSLKIVPHFLPVE
jgi:AraC-like DNA-binding protein